MKRFCILILLLAIISSLCACGGDSYSGRPAADAPSSNAPSSNAPSSNAPSSDAPAADRPVTDTPSPGHDYSDAEPTEPQTIGEYTLEDLNESSGFFLSYPDGSFGRYYSGQVVDWGLPELYTYGTERCPANLLITVEHDNSNAENIKKGTLIFKTSNDTKVYAGVFPVIESGFAMHGKRADGYYESLLWSSEYGKPYWPVDGRQYHPGTNFPSLRKIVSINGVNLGDQIVFEKEENKTYVTLKYGDIYTIGEADGTLLSENKYVVDQKYYLCTLSKYEMLYDFSEDYYPLKLQPTTEGYAIVDLSEIPSGDYIIMYSYWNEKWGERNAKMTHVFIE